MHDAPDKRILIYIVTYNAAKHIVGVLNRIPSAYWDLHTAEIYLSDDASQDNTLDIVNHYAKEHDRLIHINANKKNLGYGGNQKLGYSYAIDHDFALVVLLHGDGQYPPEYIDALTTPILRHQHSVMLGSRMRIRRNALKGGMPLYKLIGNIILTKIQNIMLHTHLSEFHTGFRAYSVEALKKIPFRCNADDFSFDTEILIQCVDNDFSIGEIEVPTFYGDEISHVNGIWYAIEILSSTITSRLQRAKIILFQKV